MVSEPNRPSKQAQAWAELAGEVGAVLLGALIFFALGWTFGVWLMVLGAIGFIVTLVRSRRGGALGRPADG